jgi:hypothetical protein
MAIIYTYPRLINLEDTDLLLISDTGTKRKPTMSVKLGDLATFINSKVDVGVTSIIAGTGITVDQPTGDVTITATGGGSGGVGGAGTPQQIAMWDTISSITDSIMEQDLANSKVSLNGSLEVGSPVQSPSQEHVSAFNAFQVNKPTPGSTDTARTGVVNIGKGDTGNFTEFDHTLNLYTPSSFSDPTNFSDAKAFEYTWNDAYKFARIEAADYAGGNISPLWEVGDLSFEINGARWQVANGDYARFITPGSPAYFEVTSTSAQFNVDTSFAGGISVSMDGNKIEDVGTPTLGNDAATKDYVDGLSDIRKVDVTVTPAQMLSLNGGNVIQLLPAPGANRMYYILNALINLKFNSIAYDFSATGLSDAVSLQLGTLSLFNDTGLNTINLNSATNTYFIGDPVSASTNIQVPVNVPINLASTSGILVSQGDSDLNISILYRDIDLSF